MGIKGLPKLIEKIANGYAVKSYEFSRFKKYTVAVDASLIIYQTVIAIRRTGKDMKNEKGQLTSHLHGIFYKVLFFLQNGMTPIFVFDGKAPSIKNKTIELRNARKLKAEESIKNNDYEKEDFAKHFAQTFRPTAQDFIECQIMLDLMGIPYIKAPGEADVICAWLASRRDENKKRYVKGVCSDDSDMLAFGAEYLFKDMLRFMNKNKPVRVFNLHKALKKMKLTQDQFYDLCVLLDCDYCEHIEGIGPVTAYQLIKTHGSLEKVLDLLKNKGLKIDKECMIEARNYFKNAFKEIDQSKEFFLTDDNLKLRTFQYDELINFMCTKHNFNYGKIESGVKRLSEYYAKMKVIRPNKKIVHQISQPTSDDFVFLSSDEECEDNESVEKSKSANKSGDKSGDKSKKCTKKIKSKEPYDFDSSETTGDLESDITDITDISANSDNECEDNQLFPL